MPLSLLLVLFFVSKSTSQLIENYVTTLCRVKFATLNDYSTVQRKYFEGYKFRGFRCFPAMSKNYFRENERMPIM